MKKKAIVSACILGEYCRYDGKTKKIQKVVDHLHEYDVIPFCPEAPLFGTPRERIDVVLCEGEHRIITRESKKDVTPLLHKEIASFIEKHPKVDAIVLKAKSPSCGYKTTPILDKNLQEIEKGSGIAAAMFAKRYKAIAIHNEENFISH